MFAALFGAAALTAIFMLLYNTIIIRFALLVLLCLAYFLKNKDFVIGFIKNRKKK